MCRLRKGTQVHPGKELAIYRAAQERCDGFGTKRASFGLLSDQKMRAPGEGKYRWCAGCSKDHHSRTLHTATSTEKPLLDGAILVSAIPGDLQLALAVVRQEVTSASFVLALCCTIDEYRLCRS